MPVDPGISSSDQCPAEEQLAAYYHGEYRTAEAGRIEAHVRHCGNCQRWLAEAERNEAVAEEVRLALVQYASVQAATRVSANAEGSTCDSSRRSADLSANATPQIEGYDLGCEVGHGTQGVVYQAVQRSTRRRVAIKVLLGGRLATRDRRERFRREVELASAVPHPNIVTVFDSGTTADGQPYYVMDFVEGLPLNRYVRARRLGVRDTLDVFRRVCEAVAAAHRRGVIHRDLKPSNILVTAEGSPKVLDFGLAKRVLGAQGPCVSMPGQVVGAPAYMSPEQARGESSEADTRSDVYALGVILYELLTGAFPYGVGGTLREILRNIEHTPPVPLRRRWDAEKGVRKRSGHTGRDSCPLDSELETIVLRALAKEPRRRYESAAELRRDIDNYLAGRPLDARRDSNMYVMRKLLRRHWIASTAAALVFISIIAALGITARSLRRSQQTLAVLNDLWANWTGSLEDAGLGVTLGVVCKAEELFEQLPPRADLQRWKNERQQMLCRLLQRSMAEALWSNDLAEANRFIAAAGKVPDTLKLLHGAGMSEGCGLDAYRRRLMFISQVPVARGHGQEALDALAALKVVDPTGEAWRPRQRAWDHVSGCLAVRWHEDFEGTEPGALPQGWESDRAMAQVVRDGTGGRCVRVTADDSTDASLRFRVPSAVTEAASTYEVSLTFRISSDARLTPDEPSIIDYQCAGGESLITLRFREHANFEAKVWTADNEYKWTFGGRGQPGVDYRVVARHYPTRGRFDLLINDHYLVEEGQCRPDKSGELIDRVLISVKHGASPVCADDVAFRAGTVPLKLDLGSLSVVTTVDRHNSGLRAVRWVPLRSDNILLADWDRDGRAEILGSDVSRPGSIVAVHMSGPALQGKAERHCFRVADDEDTSLPIRPLGCIGGLLICDRVPAAADHAHGSDGGVAFLRLRDGARVERVFESDSTSGAALTFSPFKLPGDRTGLVAAVAYSGRGIRIIERWPSYAATEYAEAGRYDLFDPPVDVHTIAAYDFDADGDDDLFLGCGHWEGYCAALVVMEDGLPRAVHRLSKPCGITRVAISSLGTRTPCLVAASRAVAASSAISVPAGIRVWRMDGIRPPSPSGPAAWLPGNTLDVVAGRFCDQEVVAVVVEEEYPDTQRSKYVIKILTFDGEHTLNVEWAAEILDRGRMEAWRLSFADLDGDGRPELTAASPQLGVLIFAGLPQPIAAWTR